MTTILINKLNLHFKGYLRKHTLYKIWMPYSVDNILKIDTYQKLVNQTFSLNLFKRNKLVLIVQQ